MEDIYPSLAYRVALVTGAANRIGANIITALHATGMNTVLHYRSSASAAHELAQRLNQVRANSVLLLQADLADISSFPALMAQIQSWRGRLDVLINNASSFFPTPLETSTEQQWDNLMGSNLKAPYFLAQAAADMLGQSKGCIINMVDIHSERPLARHPIYSMAKAGNAMMVKALARELGPGIRVNGISPGIILWPEAEMEAEVKRDILGRTALQRPGDPDDIVRTVLFLIRSADYITGQIIAVDGGRTLQQ